MLVTILLRLEPLLQSHGGGEEQHGRPLHGGIMMLLAKYVLSAPQPLKKLTRGMTHFYHEIPAVEPPS